MWVSNIGSQKRKEGKKNDAKWMKRKTWSRKSKLSSNDLSDHWRNVNVNVKSFIKMQYLRIILRKPIILTEATNGKQMHGSNESDMDKMPVKRFYQDKGDFRVEHIEAALLLLPLWDATTRIATHSHHNSPPCCLDAWFKTREKKKKWNKSYKLSFPEFISTGMCICFIFLNLS